MSTFTACGPRFEVRADWTKGELELLIFQHPKDFGHKFGDWLGENFHVWERFMQEADKLRIKGRKHYSARTIIEVLRHESALSDNDKTYKLNDHCTPNLARLYMMITPFADKFFETRVLSKDRGHTTHPG